MNAYHKQNIAIVLIFLLAIFMPEAGTPRDWVWFLIAVLSWVLGYNAAIWREGKLEGDGKLSHLPGYPKDPEIP